MAWENSDRRAHLPANWDTLRQKRFRMDDHRCTWTNTYGERCDEPAEECDHIGSRDDHRLVMLRSLCSFHHGKKSGAQGAQARNQRRQQIAQKFRRTEVHPAFL